MKKILVIFGTRPEAIKLFPLIEELKKTKGFKVSVCTTGQHQEMLDQMLDFFKVEVDYKLNVMIPNQTLASLSSGLMGCLDNVILCDKPDLIIVQGDTTTALFGALAGFYNKVKVAHIEAGLRSKDKCNPFPEEVNRKLISQIADFHFAPTIYDYANLVKEGVYKNTYRVGNTIVDMVDYCLNKYPRLMKPNRKIVVVTIHRRESFGKPLDNMLHALKNIAKNYSINIIFPVHPNPNVKNKVYKELSNVNNIELYKPIGYANFISLLKNAYLILTDSGGVQEEATILGVPTLILRDKTERRSGVQSGIIRLIGTNKLKIIKEVNALLDNIDNCYYKMKQSERKDIFGKPGVSKSIAKILLKNQKLF
jgi:UDP-N-acetylglucosamine 2-epimerase (non-hydrolysing)